MHRMRPCTVLLMTLAVAFVVLGALAVFTVAQRRDEFRHGWRECAVRPADGRRWRHGSALADGEGMDFRPGGPLGFRWPRGDTRRFHVHAAVESPGARPSMKQIWSIDPSLHVAALSTGDGRIELAAPAQDLQYLLSHWNKSAGDRDDVPPR